MLVAADPTIVHGPASVQQTIRVITSRPVTATGAGRDAGDTRRDWSAVHSIFMTWQISFDHIRGQRPSAARLLSLMSLFDRQGIPVS